MLVLYNLLDHSSYTIHQNTQISDYQNICYSVILYSLLEFCICTPEYTDLRLPEYMLPSDSVSILHNLLRVLNLYTRIHRSQTARIYFTQWVWLSHILLLNIISVRPSIPESKVVEMTKNEEVQESRVTWVIPLTNIENYHYILML